MSDNPAYFGEFGGQFVPEILLPALDQLEQAFNDAQQDPEFQKEFSDLASRSISGADDDGLNDQPGHEIDLKLPEHAARLSALRLSPLRGGSPVAVADRQPAVHS